MAFTVFFSVAPCHMRAITEVVEVEMGRFDTRQQCVVTERIKYDMPVIFESLSEARAHAFRILEGADRRCEAWSEPGAHVEIRGCTDPGIRVYESDDMRKWNTLRTKSTVVLTLTRGMDRSEVQEGESAMRFHKADTTTQVARTVAPTKQLATQKLPNEKSNRIPRLTPGMV